MSEIIRVRCGGCDVKIKAPLKYQGRRVNCPQCGQEVRIPRLDPARPPVSSSATASAKSAAVAPVLLSPAEKEPSNRQQPARPVATKPDQATVLGDDAFLDPKSAARKPGDDFANIDFADYEDYGDFEDYGAPAKPRSKSRDDIPRPRKKKKRKKSKSSSGGGFYIDPSIFGGLALMLIGGGIFVWLWNRGVIWPYAGIICIAGLIGMFKGLLGLGDD